MPKTTTHELKRGVIALALIPALWVGVAAADGRHTTTSVPRKEGWWVKRVRLLNDRVKQAKQPRLIFIGDSITKGWEDEGRQVWDKFYRPRQAINLGIGGDQTQQVLWRLRRGNLRGISPKVAVVMIGVNNAFDKFTSSKAIAEGIVAVIKLVRAKLPGTKVLLVGMLPASRSPGRLRHKIAAANRIASRVADGKMIHYIDIGARFLGPKQLISGEIMPDYLHPSAKGYAIWAKAMEAKLKQLLGEK